MSTEPISANIGYKRPSSITTARELLKKYGQEAKIVAGGQTLSLLMRHGFVNPEILVDISAIPELGTIEAQEDRVLIGATVTYDELLSHPVQTQYPALGDAVSDIAGRSVRNIGTVGGAISHSDPSLDIIPPLLCLGARVKIGSVDGTRTVTLSNFQRGFMSTVLDDHELVEAIVFDMRGDRSASAYKTHAHNGYWSTVGVCAAVTLSDDCAEITDVTVALAAVGECGIRSHSVEQALQNRSVSKAAIEEAAAEVVDDIDPVNDISGTAAYKRDLSVVLTERSIQHAIERAGGAV